MAMASSSTASLKRKQGFVSSRRTTLVMPPRQHDDKHQATPRRQVSPSLPELEAETSRASFSSSFQGSSNESTALASSGSFSLSSCSSQESFSSDEGDDSCVSQDETITTPRRLQHINKWYFGVGKHADKRSHGHASSSSSHARRWSQQTDFDILEHDIASGAFGYVHMARDTATNKIVALKQIFKQTILNKGSIKNVRAEVEIQTSLNHEHILKCFGYFDGKESISLVLEYAAFGNLWEYMMCCKDKKVPLSQAQVLIRQVASALSHLESQHVAHRDVKSENVLVTEQPVGGHVVVKLCDFGYAVTYTQDDDMHTTMCGTPEFIPPEMITDSDYSARFIDPWALGALSYELVMGKSPFYVAPRIKKRIAEERGYAEPYHVIMDKIRDFTTLERPCECDNDVFFEFLRSLLQREPFDRWSATEALGHSWLRSGDEQVRAVKRIKVEASVAV